MNLVDPLEPDGARMERAFTEFPEEMGELKAAFPELSAMDLARFLSATEYDLQLVSGTPEHRLSPDSGNKRDKDNAKRVSLTK